MLACGEPLRGDDSVAALVVGSLPPQAVRGVDLRLVGAVEPEAIVELEPGARLIIVDAVVGPPPGTIVRMDLAEMPDRAAAMVAASTHQLPLEEVVALAQLLRDDPIEGVFLGVGVASVAIGAALSEPVKAAVPRLREALVAELEGRG